MSSSIAESRNVPPLNAGMGLVDVGVLPRPGERNRSTPPIPGRGRRSRAAFCLPLHAPVRHFRSAARSRPLIADQSPDSRHRQERSWGLATAKQRDGKYEKSQPDRKPDPNEAWPRPRPLRDANENPPEESCCPRPFEQHTEGHKLENEEHDECGTVEVAEAPENQSRAVE